MVEEPTLQVARSPASHGGLIAALLIAGLGCGGSPPYPVTPTASDARALIAAGPSRNVAVTSPDPATPLQPLIVPLPFAAARDSLAALIRHLPRWSVAGATDSVVWATRTTRLFRFVDDVLLLLEPLGDSTRVHGRSGSRVGKGDMGQNRRNLAELRDALAEGRNR